MIGQIEEFPIKIEIICEIASAHEGNVENLYELLLVADSSGSDWVKLQIYQFDKLVASDNKKFSDLKIIEISPKDWVEILDFAETLRVRVIVEPFDYDSFILIKEHSAIDGFKIPTSDLLDERFVSEVLAEGKIVFIAAGGTELVELDEIMDTAKNYPATEVILLHGFQNFPTRLEDSLLNKIPEFIKRYDCRVGFADHVDANESELSRWLPAMAVAAGADVIEKHLTLNRSKKSYDYYSSLNPDEFRDFIEHINRISQALGCGELGTLSNAERQYRDNMKKFAVAAEDMDIDSPLEPAKFVFRRTFEPGLTHADMAKVKNKKMRNFVKKNKVISLDDFE